MQRIKALGGGGTDYFCIFEYIEKKMNVEKLSGIVIFTDGDADFPRATVANGIPALWLFTKSNVVAPWGKTACVI